MGIFCRPCRCQALGGTLGLPQATQVQWVWQKLAADVSGQMLGSPCRVAEQPDAQAAWGRPLLCSLPARLTQASSSASRDSVFPL